MSNTLTMIKRQIKMSDTEEFLENRLANVKLLRAGKLKELKSLLENGHIVKAYKKVLEIEERLKELTGDL